MAYHLASWSFAFKFFLRNTESFIRKHLVVVGFEYRSLSVQTHIDIPSCNISHISRYAKRHSDTFKGVPEDFSDCEKIPGQLVHICRRRMTEIVKPNMRHIVVPKELRKVI